MEAEDPPNLGKKSEVSFISDLSVVLTQHRSNILAKQFNDPTEK